MTDKKAKKISRALISVSDKKNIEELGKFLDSYGVEILSTGGSAQALINAGIPVKEVSAYTGFPEILNGRVKTLHPKIHGGILGRRGDSAHKLQMKQHNIEPIDLVVVNLYPFQETIESGADLNECIENIDIGGPSLIRAAAKNYESITVVTDPEEYKTVIASMQENDGSTTKEIRKSLAAGAYAMTAAYDGMISDWFSKQTGDKFPLRHTLCGTRSQLMRYGENPHQSAAFYKTAKVRFGVATATQIQGKELSFNNLNDTDAAFELVSEFEEPAVAIIKHANPCGVATGNTSLDAFKKALKCDPVSAFGGIIALNCELDEITAKTIGEQFVEVIIAPSVSKEAQKILAGKKNLRLLASGGLQKPDPSATALKMLAGGYLLQSTDSAHISSADLKTVSKRQPTRQELKDLIFAFHVCKHVKSNAIVYAKQGATVGIGAGQMSRVDSCRIASKKSADAATAAGEDTPLAKGSVVASDAFFPFADGLLTAAEAGATAVIQPGGSMRDDEVISAADNHNLAMVFTGVRHFRH